QEMQLVGDAELQVGTPDSTETLSCALKEGDRVMLIATVRAASGQEYAIVHLFKPCQPASAGLKGGKTAKSNTLLEGYVPRDLLTEMSEEPRANEPAPDIDNESEDEQGEVDNNEPVGTGCQSLELVKAEAIQRFYNCYNMLGARSGDKACLLPGNLF